MLRVYGGIFDHDTKINTIRVAEKASTSESHVIKTLQQLESDGIINLHLAKTDAQVTFIQPREDDKTINRIATIIEQQNKLKQEQVKAILDYAENDTVCKNMQLLAYFGEEEIEPCGICTVCLKSKKNNASKDENSIKKCIIELLEVEEQSSRAMVSALDFSEKDIKETLAILLEHDIIRITKINTYKLSHL
jgi:ATP-dependent DNA helicase RecQ